MGLPFLFYPNSAVYAMDKKRVAFPTGSSPELKRQTYPCRHRNTVIAGHLRKAGNGYRPGGGSRPRLSVSPTLNTPTAKFPPVYPFLVGGLFLSVRGIFKSYSTDFIPLPVDMCCSHRNLFGCHWYPFIQQKSRHYRWFGVGLLFKLILLFSEIHLI